MDIEVFQGPANRCPRVEPIQCEFVNGTVAPGVLVKAKLPAVDPNEDSMTWQWIVQAESTAASVGGDREPVPYVFEECIIGQEGNEVTLRMPAQPGNYRLFAIVRDGRGGAAAENVCFQVIR